MNRLKAFFYFLGIVSYGHLQAQQMKFSYVLDEPAIAYSFRNLTKYEVIDTTDYTIVYDFITLVDTLPRRTQMLLDVGKNYTNYYCWAELRLDSIYTAKYGTSPQNAVNTYSGFEQIIRNVRTAELGCCNRLPFVLERVAEYNDTPQIRWQQEEQTDSIAGYLCHLAKTEFRGRSWTAWYTTDIPHRYGPWKFSGLPGLILQVEDSSGIYKWSCSGILKRSVFMKKYQWLVSSLTRKKWLKMERTIFLNPILYASNHDITLLQMVNNQIRDIREQWTTPYNPIELE